MVWIFEKKRGFAALALHSSLDEKMRYLRVQVYVITIAVKNISHSNFVNRKLLLTDFVSYNFVDFQSRKFYETRAP